MEYTWSQQFGQWCKVGNQSTKTKESRAKRIKQKHERKKQRHK